MTLRQKICFSSSYLTEVIVEVHTGVAFQPESDGSRSGSSLSLRGGAPGGTVGAPVGTAQSPSHRGVHRSISATNAKPSRRASSGGESLRESTNGGAHSPCPPSTTTPQFQGYASSDIHTLIRHQCVAFLLLFLRLKLLDNSFLYCFDQINSIFSS